MYFATTMGSSKGTWLGWETMKIPLPLEGDARSGHYLQYVLLLEKTGETEVLQTSSAIKVTLGDG